MKILITGCKGQLGTEIQKQLRLGYSEIGPIPESLQNAEIVAVDLPEAHPPEPDDPLPLGIGLLLPLNAEDIGLELPEGVFPEILPPVIGSPLQDILIAGQYLLHPQSHGSKWCKTMAGSRSHEHG